MRKKRRSLGHRGLGKTSMIILVSIPTLLFVVVLFILFSQINIATEIVYIEKAVHLDENRNLISDIYDSVKEKDSTWSESINNNEFVRVTFEQALDKTKDITLYARTFNWTNSVNSSIEVSRAI